MNVTVDLDVEKLPFLVVASANTKAPAAKRTTITNKCFYVETAEEFTEKFREWLNHLQEDGYIVEDSVVTAVDGGIVRQIVTDRTNNLVMSELKDEMSLLKAIIYALTHPDGTLLSRSLLQEAIEKGHLDGGFISM